MQVFIASDNDLRAGNHGTLQNHVVVGVAAGTQVSGKLYAQWERKSSSHRRSHICSLPSEFFGKNAQNLVFDRFADGNIMFPRRPLNRLARSSTFPCEMKRRNPDACVDDNDHL